MPGELEALVAASDHVITEMTHDDEGGAIHLGRRDVEGLMQRHPSTRFIITHRSGNGSLNGAVMARDFLTLQLPLLARGQGAARLARHSPPAAGIIRRYHSKPSQ